MPSATIIDDDGSFDMVLKILMIGNSSVGKTSLVSRFVGHPFRGSTTPSLGIDLEVVTVVKRRRKLRLQIWDTAGQERFRSLSTSFYRMGKGFVLVYDVTSEASFLAITNWVTHLKTHAGSEVYVVLVGNKTDLEKDRVVPQWRGRQLADDLGFSFFETSAARGSNVHSAFENAIDMLLDDYENRGEAGCNDSIMLAANTFDGSNLQAIRKGKGVKAIDITGTEKCIC